MTGLLFYCLGSCPVMPHLLQKLLLLSSVFLTLEPCFTKATYFYKQEVHLLEKYYHIVIENLENRETYNLFL